MTEPTDGTSRKLRELAQNLWWSWQPDTRAIFRNLDPALWRTVHHNPVALLQRMDSDEVTRRVQDLELQTRIELTENQATFGRMGFVKTAETAHEGFDRPTSITMRAKV